MKIKLTKSNLHKIIKESVNKVLKEGHEQQLSDNAILALAKIVVEEFGHGNCIDLNNPKDLIETVKYVMRMQRCDELEALKYMSGIYGGGWG